MEKEQNGLENLQIRNLQQLNLNPTSKNSLKMMTKTNRNILKQFLSKQILEECLKTFDLFKQIIEDPIQKVKLLRDVMKNLSVKLYDEHAIIYNKGDASESIFMVVKGVVALCLPVFQQRESSIDEKVIYDYQEIDSYEEGVGFGESQFIHSKKRGLAAIVKQNGSVVGSINAKSFEQIIESYKQRVYYKKMEMFSKCPLLKNLQPFQLQFIVNNAKIVNYQISKEIVCQGQKPKALHLIIDGNVELRRKQKEQSELNSKLSRDFSKKKITLKDSKIRIKHVVVGALTDGSYLGDCEIGLNSCYSFSAICTSQKTKAYICDIRIIESQMSEQLFQKAKQYYRLKNSFREMKVDAYENAKSRIQKSLDDSQSIVLSSDQKKIKRKINNRYYRNKPTLVDQLSPQEISISLNRKYNRIKTTVSPDKQMQKEDLVFDFMSFNSSPVKKLVRNERSFSPILRKQYESKKKYSEPTDLETVPLKKIRKPSPLNQPLYYQISLHDKVEEKPISQTQPMLVFMSPFHRKVETLHERLAKQYNNMKMQKEKELNRVHKIRKEHELQLGSIGRLGQFISKVQQTKQKKVY